MNAIGKTITCVFKTFKDAKCYVFIKLFQIIYILNINHLSIANYFCKEFYYMCTVKCTFHYLCLYVQLNKIYFVYICMV